MRTEEHLMIPIFSTVHGSAQQVLLVLHRPVHPQHLRLHRHQQLRHPHGSRQEEHPARQARLRAAREGEHAGGAGRGRRRQPAEVPLSMIS